MPAIELNCGWQSSPWYDSNLITHLPALITLGNIVRSDITLNWNRFCVWQISGVRVVDDRRLLNLLDPFLPVIPAGWRQVLFVGVLLSSPHRLDM